MEPSLRKLLPPLLCSPRQQWLKFITPPLLSSELHGVAARALHHQGMPILFWAHSPSMVWRAEGGEGSCCCSHLWRHLRSDSWGCQTPRISTAAKNWKKKSQNNHCAHSETLFGETLSVHALFVMLPKRCAFLSSPLRKHCWICGFPTSAVSSVCGSLSKAQVTLHHAKRSTSVPEFVLQTLTFRGLAPSEPRVTVVCCSFFFLGSSLLPDPLGATWPQVSCCLSTHLFI